MPMKMAIKTPNIRIADSPMSTIILDSCDIESSPRKIDAPTSNSTNKIKLYNTRSRTDSRNVLSAIGITFIAEDEGRGKDWLRLKRFSDA